MANTKSSKANKVNGVQWVSIGPKGVVGVFTPPAQAGEQAVAWYGRGELAIPTATRAFKTMAEGKCPEVQSLAVGADVAWRGASFLSLPLADALKQKLVKAATLTLKNGQRVEGYVHAKFDPAKAFRASKNGENNYGQFFCSFDTKPRRVDNLRVRDGRNSAVYPAWAAKSVALD